MHISEASSVITILTALGYIAVLPSGVTVGGEAPRPLSSLPRVPAEVVPTLQLRVVSKVEQVLVRKGGVPWLA